MSDWPDGWEKVTCPCGEVIGGYNRNSPPDVFQIKHGCGQVTTLWPSGVMNPYLT